MPPLFAGRLECGSHAAVAGGDAREYTFTGLAPDTAYKIRVQAVNKLGEGARSPTLLAQTVQGACLSGFFLPAWIA